MYQCKNEKHNDDMKLIFAQQGFCSNQSGAPKYDGDTFSHCPFCGEKLETITKSSKIDTGSNGREGFNEML